MSWEKQPRFSGTWISPVLKKGGFAIVSSLGTFLLLAGSSLSAGDAEAGLPPGDMGMASLKMGAALLIVIAMILGLYYLSRKLRDGRFLVHRYPAMKVIGSLNLAPKRSIALVEVCGEWLVLGIGTENITLLRRFEEPPVNNTESLPAGIESSGGFQALLRRKLKREPTGSSDRREKDGTPH